MPELPEVETIVRELIPELVGARFLGMKIFWNKSVNSVKNFDKIKNKKIISISRRGKFINIFFDNEIVVTIHLRMTGRLILINKNSPELEYERVRLDFDRRSLGFCDVRKFGRIWINSKKDFEKNTGMAKLGAEPFSRDFNFHKFSEIFTKKKGNIKKLLLDQTLLAGIGNIYADEGLFMAKIRPSRKIENLKTRELKNLYNGLMTVLKSGIKNLGTSVSDFIAPSGEKGKNQHALFVYKRGGKPCLICGYKLIKTKLAGRGTVYCENCQK